jgi:hypothetical protein
MRIIMRQWHGQISAIFQLPNVSGHGCKGLICGFSSRVCSIYVSRTDFFKLTHCISIIGIACIINADSNNNNA